MSSSARRATRRTFRYVAACLPVLVLLASCAPAPRPAPPPRNVFILLPDDNGKAGTIVVSAAGTERVLSEPNQAVRVAPGAPPGERFAMSADEVRAVAGPALSALPPPPVVFILYFRNGTADLTTRSGAAVDEIVRAIRERPAVDVSVVGHTDTVGDREYNDRLSLRRARAVARILAVRGVDASIVEITSHGKNNPLVPTGDQVAEPRNRRVEVTVR